MQTTTTTITNHLATHACEASANRTDASADRHPANSSTTKPELAITAITAIKRPAAPVLVIL